MNLRDPSAMTAAERRAELASIFARGYLRHLAERRNSLDAPESAEAPCDDHERTRD